MKTTLKQIIDSAGAIQLLMGAKLPVKASYAVSKLAKACQSEMEDYNKTREKLFEDAGCTQMPAKDAKGNVQKNTDGTEMMEYVHPEDDAEKSKVKAVVAKVEELHGAEVSLNALPLDLEQFGNAEVPGAAFFGLEWAMKE